MDTEERPEGTTFVLIKHFKEADEYYLANNLPLILCILASYLLFVLVLGPAFMKNREPYKLKKTILVYNAAQVLLSLWLIALTANLTFMFFPKRCIEDDPVTRKELLDINHVYVFCKITELLDTVFFVLRKKYNQVTFLHVYHHTLVVIGTWLIFMLSPNQSGIFAAFVNAIVHVIMYSYYFLAALGPQYQKYLVWKKSITSLQLVQFIAVICHQILSLIFVPCQYTIFGVVYVIVTCIIFYLLFNNFYNKSYQKPKGARDEIKNGADKTQ